MEALLIRLRMAPSASSSSSPDTTIVIIAASVIILIEHHDVNAPVRNMTIQITITRSPHHHTCTHLSASDKP